jgi:hypothetical protein
MSAAPREQQDVLAAEVARLRDEHDLQRTLIDFLLAEWGEAIGERDHARNLAVAMSARPSFATLSPSRVGLDRYLSEGWPILDEWIAGPRG